MQGSTDANPVPGDSPTPYERAANPVRTPYPGTGESGKAVESEKQGRCRATVESDEERAARAALLRQSSWLLRDVDEPRAPNEEQGASRHFVPFDECEGCGRFLELADLERRLCPSCVAQVAA
jgi:hypothetical protein